MITNDTITTELPNLKLPMSNFGQTTESSSHQ